MRFENMRYLDQQKILAQFHRKLNRDFFNNELNTIPISIENINKSNNQSDYAYAMFLQSEYLFDPKTKKIYCGEKICFDHIFVDFIASQKYKKNQVFYISYIMLHEMIHQYCFEKGIDDSNHGNGWAKAAADHHFISNYENGKIIEDHPDTTAELIFSGYRF